MPLPPSVQDAVADDASNVARTFGDEFEIAALVAAVHVPENPLQVTVQPGFLPLGPAVMLSRLPDSCVAQGRFAATALGLAQVPAVVVQLVVVTVSIVSAPLGLTVPVSVPLQVTVKLPPSPPVCDSLRVADDVVDTDPVTDVPSTCQTVNADADEAPAAAVRANTDMTASPRLLILLIDTLSFFGAVRRNRLRLAPG